MLSSQFEATGYNPCMTDQKSVIAQNDDTICALATPAGTGGIGVIRISGPEAFVVADCISARRSSKKCSDSAGHTLHRADIIEASGEVIDDVLLVDEGHFRDAERENISQVVFVLFSQCDHFVMGQYVGLGRLIFASLFLSAPRTA